ncbi:MAG: carboxypeptidase regulatory-like domain-containing protein [Candidatus Hydrogenedentes bacterium]|nr:carboxypeptidase regulatory-like domain-containing protein [Candidatus Hydrogenedentota bacterium]
MTRIAQVLIITAVNLAVISCARSTKALPETGPNYQATTTVPEIQPSPPTLNRSVVGRVTDEAQNPIAGARVLAVLTKEETAPFRSDRLSVNYMQRSRVTETVTTADGSYAINGFAHKDEIELSIQAKGFADNRRSARLDSGYEKTVRDVVLTPGLKLQGRVTAPDGSPVNDAIIDVDYAWMAKGHRQLPWAYTLTDDDGRFLLGIDRETDWISLHVISERNGLYFFIKQEAKGEMLLKMEERASLSGKVVAPPGTALDDLVIFVDGEVPEPPMYAPRTGLRASDPRFITLDSDGHFEFTELYPGLKYRANVLRPVVEKTRRFDKLLAEDVYHALKPESKGEWNPSVPE